MPAGELIFAAPTIGNEFDPSLRNGGAATGMYTYLMETTAEGAFDTAGGFVQSWSSNADYSQWTFKLRRDVAFHDGSMATAADFKYAVQRGIDPKGVQALGGVLRGQVASVAVPDDSTLVVNLTGLFFSWPIDWVSRNRVATGMPNVVLHSRYVQRVGDAVASRTPVGSGPYRFKSVEIGDRLTLEAVDDKHFFFGTPRIKTLVHVQIPESSTRVALLKTQKADLTAISPSNVNEITAVKGLRVVRREDAQEALLYHAQYPTDIPGYGKNPLSIKEVRQALYWHAIDRKQLVATFLRGLGTPSMDNPVPKTDIYAYVPQPIPSFDLAKAKAMLAAAGYPNGFKIDYWIGTQSPLPEAPEIMEAIAAWWEQVGVVVNRIPFTGGAFQKAIVDHYQKGWTTPTVQGLIWSGALRETNATFAVLAHSRDALYHLNEDPEGLRLASAFAGAKTPDAYKAAGQAYQKYVHEQATHFMILFTGHDIYAASDRVWSGWKLGKDSATLRLEYAAAKR